MRIKAIIGAASSSILLVAGLAGGVASAAPSTVYVGKAHCLDTGTGAGSAAKPYCTVQEGVNAAASGDTVRIDKGTYTEQVTVGSGKNNVTLAGNGNNTVLAAPAVMTSPKTILSISGATGVTVANLTVSGPGSGGCDSLEYGIRIDGAGQASISGVHVSNIADSPFSGCQNGVGIQVGRAADSTTGSATISNTNVDGFQKNGITVSNTGSSATISNTNVTGAGPTTVIAQNGIQISSGATATLSNDNVKNDVYTGPADAADGGILLFDSGVVNISNVSVTNTDVGFWLTGVTNSQFTNDSANKSTYNGIYADADSKGNTFTNNSAKNTSAGALNFDMEDDSVGTATLGTANTWHNNSCKTSSPVKLCKQ